MNQRNTCLVLLAAVLTLILVLPPAALSQNSLQVAVISDVNGSYGTNCCEPGVAEAIRRLVELKPDLVIITGDMIAGQRPNPVLSDDAIEKMWISFHAEVTEPIRDAGIALAVTPGNHDASVYEKFAHEREIYRKQWLDRVPNVSFVDRNNYPFDYAFSVGKVLFVSLEATRKGPFEKNRLHWLDSLLEHQGKKFQNSVVFSHLPVFPFTQGQENHVTGDLELEQLLKRHGVDLYLSGHHHAFYPGIRDGVRYVGQSCLGANPRKLIGSEQVSERAVTWLEFHDSRLEITALVVPQLDDAIDIKTLPPSIQSSFGTLIREDLALPVTIGMAAFTTDIFYPWKGTTP